MAVLEWLVRLLNVNFDIGGVPLDWHGAYIVPLFKGNGDKCKCSNSRGISLLSVVGKLHGSMLTERVRAGIECAAWVKCLLQDRCEKYQGNLEDVFWAFMDLERAYDIIDRHGI